MVWREIDELSENNAEVKLQGGDGVGGWRMRGEKEKDKSDELWAAVVVLFLRRRREL